MKILLVDDEPAMLKMTKRMLQSRGFQVFDASSAANALALSKEHLIDLLVTDVVMEEIDGKTLAHALVERQPDLPVLFISGFPMDIEAERQKYPHCAFLPKPFHADDLVDAIVRLTGTQ